MTTSDSAEYESLRPLMRRFGATCTPKEFYWAVNESFHAAESASYDEQHASMFCGAEPMWRRLLSHLPTKLERLEVLDIGAGTGLVGEYLAKICGERVAKLTALDPSAPMLERARRRARSWPFECNLVCGTIDEAPSGSFDLVTVSSVLHHVVELRAFCATIGRLMRPGGYLLTMQDPSREAYDDLVFTRRREWARRVRDQRSGPMKRLWRLAGSALRSAGVGRTPQLAKATNEPLRAKKIIARPMTLDVIWAITDFHVPGQPGAIGKGLSIRDLETWMPGLQLVDEISYQFHGVPWNLLSQDEQKLEQQYWSSGDRHGQLFGTAWIKRTK